MENRAPLGSTTPAFRIPAHDRHDDPHHSWMLWHFQALVRAAGLTTARIDRAYLQTYRMLLTGTRQECLGGQISGQISYHARNVQRSRGIADRLHGLGVWLLVFILIVCGVHLLPSHILPSAWATLFAAGLPALGAAVAGILSQAELERIAKRSGAMSQQLQEIVDRLNQQAPAELSLAALGELAQDAAYIMTAEVLDWRVVFRAKPLGDAGVAANHRGFTN